MKTIFFRIYFLMVFALLGWVPALSADAATRLETPEKERLLSWLEKSRAAYENVRDYEATFTKQESSDHVMGPEETIYLKFEKPFKIYMKWLNTSKKGLEVLYERGRHDGKLAIHKPGLFFGLAPVVFLDQNSPWVREGSASYDIEDAGIGTFLADFYEAVTRGDQEGKLEVRFEKSSREFSDPTAEVLFKNSKKDSTYFAYRIVVGFDADSNLPTKMALYDWENQPIGIYRYEDLKLNVGSSPESFRQQIHRQLYKVALPKD